MKRKTLEKYIRHTTKPYTKILDAAQNGGWDIKFYDDDPSTVKLSKYNEPPIFLYFEDPTLRSLTAWQH